MSIFEINAKDIINRCQSDGEEFTKFVDSLIYAELWTHSVPASNLHINTKVNQADGGVDTKLDVAVEDDPSGYLTEKTIWQYKAGAGKNIHPLELKKGKYLVIVLLRSFVIYIGLMLIQLKLPDAFYIQSHY